MSAYNVDEIVPVESNRELFANAVSILPTVDPAKLLAKQKEEFSTYYDYLLSPHTAPVPPYQS